MLRPDPSIAADFKEATAYLRKSPTAKRIIDALEKSRIVFSIHEITANNGSFVQHNRQPTDANAHPEVEWNPHLAPQTNAGYESPANVLAHELSHAYEWSKRYAEYSRLRDDGYFTSAEEERATRVQSKIATELHEAPRHDYDDYGAEPRWVDNPTATEGGPFSEKGTHDHS